MEPKSWDMTSSQSPGTGTTGSDTPGSGVLDQARESTNQILEQARSMTDKVVEQAKTEGSRRLSAQIDQASERVDHVSGAIRSLGGQLRESDETRPIAGYVDMAADQIDRASEYLKGKDLDAIVSEIESFGRERPMLFVGVAFGLGVLAARFLRSTPVESIHMPRTGYGDSGQWAA